MEVTPRLDMTAATRYVRLSDCFRAFLSATRRAAADAASSSSEGTGSGAGPGAWPSCGTKHVTVSCPRLRAVRVNGENGRGRPAREGSVRKRAAAASRGFLTAKLVMVEPERPAAMEGRSYYRPLGRTALSSSL